MSGPPSPSTQGRPDDDLAHEHKRAVCRGDPLFPIATRTLREDHEFNFVSTRIVARANNKTGRELLEAPDTNSITRHVDIPLLLSRAPFPRPRGETQFPAKSARSHATARRRGTQLIALRSALISPPPSWLDYEDCSFDAAFSQSLTLASYT
nr:unnamed protein product [Spirometra erinaceieuropaei]